MPTLSTSDDKIIGLSLSLCVSQMARGEVKMDDVQKLITATDAPNIFAFIVVLYQYCKNYWREYPIRACAIALFFYFCGLIDQPRTRGEEVNFIGDGKWMDSEKNTFSIGSNGVRQYSGHKLRAWN